jgi:hypothetical protein
VNEQSGIDNLGGIYSVMTVDLYLRRRSLFFSFNFILPSLMITICGIFGFMLPPDCGEKINLREYFFHAGVFKIYFLFVFI